MYKEKVRDARCVCDILCQVCTRKRISLRKKVFINEFENQRWLLISYFTPHGLYLEVHFYKQTTMKREIWNLKCEVRAMEYQVWTVKYVLHVLTQMDACNDDGIFT